MCTFHTHIWFGRSVSRGKAIIAPSSLESYRPICSVYKSLSQTSTALDHIVSRVFDRKDGQPTFLHTQTGCRFCECAYCTVLATAEILHDTSLMQARRASSQGCFNPPVSPGETLRRICLVAKSERTQTWSNNCKNNCPDDLHVTSTHVRCLIQ